MERISWCCRTMGVGMMDLNLQTHFQVLLNMGLFFIVCNSCKSLLFKHITVGLGQKLLSLQLLSCSIFS